MNNRFDRLFRLVSVLLIASLSVTTISAQGTKEEREKLAEKIKDRTANGIYVGSPKVYDDSSLQMMLNNARARLAAIQSLDQTGLLSRIGAVSGASLTQSSFALNVNGPPIPGSSVTNNAPTGNTVVGTANGGSTVTTTNLPVQGTVTNNPQQNPTIPTAPTGGVALPTSGFSVSALDALSEQMQLTFEIANLQLLLEGSFNDRFIKGTRLIKPRTTLGFPITISSLPQYKNAVAVVEVQVTNADRSFGGTDRPAVTALLPREKTYNVAALTDKMTSIGGGVVTSVISGGFSLLRGRKSYYIVQDQDTIAKMIEPDTSVDTTTAFSWEFRPVLGQSFVKSGLKQTFVQLSAPLEAAANCFGTIKVRTYWRHVDRKTGVLKDVIPESITDVNGIEAEIPRFDLTPVVENATYDDVGNGQIRANIEGKFLSGTYVRVGNSAFREGSPGFVFETTRIQFVTSAADVAKYKAYFVLRDGTETEIVNPLGSAPPPKFINTCNSLPDPAKGFNLRVPLYDISIEPGSRQRIGVTVTSPATASNTVTLSVTGQPKPGPRSGWSVSTLKPAKGTSLNSFFTLDVDPTAAPGDYTVQIQASADPLRTQSHDIRVHVGSPVRPSVKADVISFDDSKSIVTATVTNQPDGPDEYLMVINDRVFGLMDAPIQRDSANHIYRAVVPTSLVSGPTTVKVQPLFWDKSFTSDYRLDNKLESIVDKVVVFNRTDTSVTFLLYGSRLSGNVIKVPTGITLHQFGQNDLSTIGTFTLSKDQWGAIKQIVLQKADNQRPVFVAIPQPEPPPKITLTVGGRVAVGTNEVVVTGDTFDKLLTVTFNKTTTIAKVFDPKEPKSVKLTGLVAAGVTSIAGEPELLFEYEEGKKNTLKLEVVTGKVEVIQKQ